MIEKNLEICILFDYYGSLLGNNRREAVDLYYNEDLSLSEIAEHMNISRQGVWDLIKHSEQSLYEFDEKLKLIQKNNEIKKIVSKIIAATDNAEIIKLANELSEKYL